MATNEDFAAMHTVMKHWVEAQRRDGWQSPAIENHAERVLCALWACAHNRPIDKSLLEMLAEDTEALAKAKAEAAAADALAARGR